jgi:NAD+ kinase
MKLLGVTANIYKDRADEAVSNVCKEALKNGFSVVVDSDSAELAGSGVEVVDSIYKVADAIVALGGDGTMLRVTRELEGADKPILGVNIGNLGFLTSVGLSDVADAFKALAAGEYGVAERAIVECRVTRGGSQIASYHALNDAVITNTSPSRVVTLDVSVGDDEGTSFVGDGLIVATPSGSTGHSLSSGGPIVHPGVKAMVMSLICPQTLSSRPMVIPSGKVVRIRVQSSSGKEILTIDGQVSLPLETGDEVEVSDSDRCVKFVQMKDYSYFSVLRQKLHWSLSNTRDADS